LNDKSNDGKRPLIQIWNSIWPAMSRAVRENLLLMTNSTLIIGKL
jgi:hypothetical protein